MRLPVTLFDVKLGRSADDPEAVVVATCKQQHVADGLVRSLASAQGRGDVVNTGAYFVAPRNAEIEHDSEQRAEAGGFALRYVLAAVEAAPVEEPAPVESEGGELLEGGGR
jgi:hypothetical protein